MVLHFDSSLNAAASLAEIYEAHQHLGLPMFTAPLPRLLTHHNGPAWTNFPKSRECLVKTVFWDPVSQPL